MRLHGSIDAVDRVSTFFRASTVKYFLICGFSILNYFNTDYLLTIHSGNCVVSSADIDIYSVFVDT